MRPLLSVITFFALAPLACSSNGTSADAGALNNYLSSLPAWPPPEPDFSGPIDAGITYLATGSDGLDYQCTTTPYSLTSTPQQVVTFNPNVDVLWPGALIQGAPFQNGALVSIPITERAPLTVSIPTLLFSGNSQTVDHPSVATVQQAVGSIVGASIAAKVQASSSVSYNETSAHTVDQAALQLGISAKYLGFNANASFKWSNNVDTNTVMAYFVQNMFTVTVPEPEDPADFFSGLTQAGLDSLQARGDISASNLPLYISSVTYGRMMMFSLSAQTSTTDIEAALSAQYSGVNGGGGGDAGYSNLFTQHGAMFTVVTVGGAAQNAEAMIESGDPSKFFSSDPDISTAVPISYVVRNLRDNSIAAVSDSTSYSVRSCTPTSVGPVANYYVLNGTGFASTYDRTGTPITLNNTLGPGPGLAAAIAYDSFDDIIFILGGADGRTLLSYAPDGRSLNMFPNVYPGAYLFYDPQYNRLYIPSTTFDSRVLAFTTQGVFAGGYFTKQPVTSVVYVPTTSQLYFAEGSAVEVQTLIGQPGAVVTGAFSAATSGGSAQALVYDPVHDLIFVGGGGLGGNKGGVWAYKPDGTLMEQLPALPGTSMLAYDQVDDQLAVEINYHTLWQLFKHDGTPVPLAPGAFSNVSNPFGVAFRP